jgi:3-dehydro-4-phosphotetronate decarboxylase
MNESKAREEICRVGQSLFARGYVHSTAGNISVRLVDSFLITPTDVCLGFLDPARISKVAMDGTLVSGDRPSKTLALHRRIYEAHAAAANMLERASTARCVIHTHSTNLVALTLFTRYAGGLAGVAELLPALTPYFVMKVGRVPVVPYARPGSPNVAETVASYIARYATSGVLLRAAMIERLGPNVWHGDPSAAMATLEELEETAKLAIVSGAMRDPDVTPLTDEMIGELKTTFGADW